MGDIQSVKVGRCLVLDPINWLLGMGIFLIFLDGDFRTLRYRMRIWCFSECLFSFFSFSKSVAGTWMNWSCGWKDAVKAGTEMIDSCQEWPSLYPNTNDAYEDQGDMIWLNREPREDQEFAMVYTWSMVSSGVPFLASRLNWNMKTSICRRIIRHPGPVFKSHLLDQEQLDKMSQRWATRQAWCGTTHTL